VSEPANQLRSLIPECIGPFIDGQWHKTTPANTLPVIDPATEESVADLAEDGPDVVDAAVASARRAFDSGDWPRVPVVERKRLLLKIRDLILENRQILAELETLDTGIPIRQSFDRHIPRAALNFEFFAEFISQTDDKVFHQNPDYVTMVRHDPVGVAGLLAPWNVPLALATMKLAGALAFGNTCILKPSELTPLPFVVLMDLLQAAGVPPGVVNLVNGRGPVTGAAMVAHADVDVIAFTGGTATGRSIGESAGRGLKKLVTELGGKSANIVFRDADLESALDGTLIASFSGNGQQCLAGSRLLLHRSIAEPFIEALVSRVRSLRIGVPQHDSTDIGPLISAQQLQRVSSYADIAREEAAEILTGGRVADQPRGYYFEPTVVLAPHNRLRVCQEEIFGPFLTVIVFDEVEEALQIANESEFGLVAYVWTESLATAMAAADALRTGVVWVNTPVYRELRAPFGGFKASGVGRTGGAWSRSLFTEEKAISIARRPLSIPKFGA
jgi:5-carboxymethyl-2-hydroxymuconic-semialdehyde dehydrogenase/aminomuconate-semialdehyde/2-hydroxymuconate-6-semialdehyde dehydrogenase